MADKVTEQEAARRLKNELNRKEKRKPNEYDIKKKVTIKKQKKPDQQQ
jgi:hypothetical protein